MEPALAKFLARHAVSEREAIEKDVAELRALTPEATWRIVDSVCLSAADVLTMRPDRIAVLTEREPPHPSYFEVLKRLKPLYRNPRS